MNKSLEQLLSHPNIWQARQGRQIKSVISTGYEMLDNKLHDRGWPLGATTELLGPSAGVGELRLLLPALRQQQQRPWVLFLGPPFLPYAPAFAAAGIDPQRLLVVCPRNGRELLWSADQALRSGSCGAVITWGTRQAISDRDLRRLQQAAHEGNCWHVLFRPREERLQASPSALRMHFESTSNGDLQLQVLKQRGGWSGQTLRLPLPASLQQRQRLPAEQLPVHLGPQPSVKRRAPLATPTTPVTALAARS